MLTLHQLVTKVVLLGLVVFGAFFVLETTVLAQQPDLSQSSVFTARVVEISSEEQHEYTPGQASVSQVVKLVSVENEELEFEVEFNRLLSEGESKLSVGDKVLVNQSLDPSNNPNYYIIDFVRTNSLLLLAAVFFALVVTVGKLKGLRSLVGLVSTFAIIFFLILPGIKQGVNPLFVAISGSVLIMTFSFYLSHGISKKTSIAIAGTFISLLLTGVLAVVFINASQLTGFSSEEASFLQVLQGGQFNVKSLLLAGIIIGALGVLDDITISQVSIVEEIKKSNPKLKDYQLFNQAMNVGRDHIASLVNTLILAYTGSALPLLVLFSFDQSRSFSTVINYEIIAEEIVRTLVASSGLVAAVPITTFLAANTYLAVILTDC